MTDTETVPGLLQIGETLRAARDGRGLSLDQAAARLRCDVRVLESLEAGRFADVGPPVFARGHLLRYAEMLGESGEAMLAAWTQSADGTSAASELLSDQHPRRVRDLRQVRRRLVTGTALLCIAIVAVWGLQQLGARSRAAPTSAASLADARPVPAASDAPPRAPEPVLSTEPSVTAAATRAEPAGPAVATTVEPSVPDAVAAAPSQPARAVAGLAATASVPVATEPAAPASAAPARDGARLAAAEPTDATAVRLARLAVTASAETWLEIYDRRNRRLFFGVARPGTMVDVRGGLPLRVVVGNVPAATFELDGRRLDVPREAMRGRRAATFRVGPDGRPSAVPRA